MDSGGDDQRASAGPADRLQLDTVESEWELLKLDEQNRRRRFRRPPQLLDFADIDPGPPRPDGDGRR
jgi:hypothetical protein